MDYLSKSNLDENAWYGFFVSQIFFKNWTLKTGLYASKVISIVSRYRHEANVALFSPA